MVTLKLALPPPYRAVSRTTAPAIGAVDVVDTQHG